MTESEYYLDKARRGEGEAAYHGLVELPDATLPALLEAFSAEPDPAVRSLIVHAFWQHRPSAIGLLGLALDDPHSEVWKEALDGLVTLASPESRGLLEAAKGGRAQGDPERLAWIVEAIADIDGDQCGIAGTSEV
jgi:hypothetical protein